ncbi:hypothetical protein LOK49_LG15G01693 [Camellia lanceoleosa]|uniref:Uncharacterized protein n=1 Tax=Camellia lanceoleosa TaxID=1840588 RepID=A0ACC0F7C7_9ERIC|nr:hypothetical protein LOK49_LG15G01693 [Camellia lanceoleosa]
MVSARQRFSMGKEDLEIAENRDTVVAPPRKSVVEPVDQRAFLDEIEAPMWIDLDLEAASAPVTKSCALTLCSLMAFVAPITESCALTLRSLVALECTSLLTFDFAISSNQSTEVDLFEEIRASIEKFNIMSNICKSVCKSGLGEAHKRETHSLKKLDDISRNRVKSTPTSRKQSVFMQGSKRVKEVVHPQIFQDAKKNGKSNLFRHKSPKILGRMNIVLAGQRFSMGKQDPEIAENRDTIVAPPRKSVVEPVDQWTFLDEIEAPKG